ncbi:SAVED domain-containing protein [Stenotrophomonas sp. PS02301]|uniref:SAVED domain-containing protein n=1 Tax=Stenotrophomonas sp. PS02301 TaxID=2991427 RepID=UPI00249C94C8|nr:SAVED domain-containing protein [Stenotrophomonas sp. PS02301]
MSWSSKLQDWISLLVHWITRRRHPSRFMLHAGVGMVAASLAGGWTFGVRGSAGALHLAGFASTSDGLPKSLLVVVLFFGLLLALTGAGVLLFDWKSFRNAAERSAVVVVEFRGLIDTSDSSLLKSVPRGLIGQRLDALIDVRELAVAGAIKQAMQKVVAMPDLIRLLRGSRAKSDVQVVVGGVLHVPLLFLAGTMLDDEGRVLPFDWDRVSEVWKALDEPDDGERFTLSGMDELPSGTPRVVLAISASYRSDAFAIKDSFGDVPVVSLSLANPLPGTLWSGAKQDALAAQFTAAVATLGNKGVKRISLVLAASSTLALRMGRAYDRRNMPEIACYQYERKPTPAYPWSVLIGPSDVELIPTTSEDVTSR